MPKKLTDWFLFPENADCAIASRSTFIMRRLKSTIYMSINN